MYQAHHIVASAVRVGLLPSLTDCNIVCSDCKQRRATAWEHRDYSKPLYVRPVCDSCNGKAGRADVVPSKPPSPQMLKELLKLGHRVRMFDVERAMKELLVDTKILSREVVEYVLFQIIERDLG